MILQVEQEAGRRNTVSFFPVISMSSKLCLLFKQNHNTSSFVYVRPYDNTMYYFFSCFPDNTFKSNGGSKWISAFKNVNTNLSKAN